eukprot:scaffold17443_cov38-Cyclotella_meneghiniana.AAC.1
MSCCLRRAECGCGRRGTNTWKQRCGGNSWAASWATSGWAASDLLGVAVLFGLGQGIDGKEMATHPVGATNWDHCPHLHRWHRWTENKNCSSMLLRGVVGW